MFVVGAVVAWDSLDLDLAAIRWWPLVVVGVVLVPATVLVNVLELLALARVLGVAMPFRDGVRVVLLATAANFLPVPGAAAVRIRALTGHGARLGAATAVNVLGALAWVGVALVIAGVAGLGIVPLGAAVLLVGGLAGVGLTATLLLRWQRASAAATGALFGAELLTVVGHALRLGLVLVALRQTGSVPQVLVLAANGPLAAAAGVFPSGLGLAEVLGAALAAMVALAPAAGLAATAVNRLIGVAVTAPMAAVLGIGELRGVGSATGRRRHDPGGSES